jgi:hypothetical protein
LIGDKVQEGGRCTQRLNARESRLIANRRHNVVTGEAESPASRRTHVAAADNAKAPEYNEGVFLQIFTDWPVATWGLPTSSGAHECLGCLGLEMDSVSRENWFKIAATLGRSDSAGSWFYARAKAIAEGRPDPLAELDRFPT